MMENPAPWSIKSGVGIISGWVCEAEELAVRFDAGPQKVVPSGLNQLLWSPPTHLSLPGGMQCIGNTGEDR